MPKRPTSSRALSSCRHPPDDAGAVARTLTALVSGYRYTFRAVLPPSCRFAPSCSEYATTAIRRHGAVRGGRLVLWRLVRCNPWNAGGWDPVPGGEH
jgi:putative membrane protein insertion efficiency factor